LSSDWWRKIFVVAAHRADGKRFVVRSGEKLTAFMEIEKGTRHTGSGGGYLDQPNG
jgi:hypothetical protein